MSVEIVGLGRDHTSKYREMRDVWEACLNAGVEPPAEVRVYLDGASRQETGVADAVVVRDGAVEVDLGKLPSHVHTLRITEVSGGL